VVQPFEHRNARRTSDPQAGMLKINLHGRAMRWAAGVVGCALGASGLAAVLLHLRAADPWVVALAVSTAVWLAWVAFDYALSPLRIAGAAGAHRAFSDTQAN
jgi:hypothetical protein